LKAGAPGRDHPQVDDELFTWDMGYNSLSLSLILIIRWLAPHAKLAVLQFHPWHDQDHQLLLMRKERINFENEETCLVLFVCLFVSNIESFQKGNVTN
jgi:hypothetical protein